MTGYGGMSDRDVLDVVAWIKAHGFTYQINGGWAVDAHVGHQTRTHDDLDVFIDAAAVPVLLGWLQTQGYVEETEQLPARVQLRRGLSRVDVHPMTLDPAGDGTQWDRAGRALYVHPAAARTTGMIGGHQVCVATVPRLRELRRGYPPRGVDRHDLRLLDRCAGGDSGEVDDADDAGDQAVPGERVEAASFEVFRQELD